MSRWIHQKENRWRVCSVAGAIFLTALLGACAGIANRGESEGSRGRLQSSVEVTRMLTNGPISTDYNYYFTGSRANPRAIMGLNKEYELETRVWQSLAPADGSIQAMIRTIESQRGVPKANFGAVILDPEGKRIGVWYSREARTTRVTMLGDGFVSVFPPAFTSRSR